MRLSINQCKNVNTGTHKRRIILETNYLIGSRNTGTSRLIRAKKTEKEYNMDHRRKIDYGEMRSPNSYPSWEWPLIAARWNIWKLSIKCKYA